MNNFLDNLKVIRDKETIIATFEAEQLRKIPADVKRIYEVHNATHIEIGESDAVFNNLVKWVTQNKSAAVGAVIGDYGYGKTSFLVHLWAGCRGEGILAVPPFSWMSTGELVDGIYGWCRFEFSRKPALKKRLDALYGKIRNKSLESIARKIDANAQKLLENLTKAEIARLTSVTPADILRFMDEVTNIALEGGYSGLVVFTDELQRTVDSYESLPRFYEDLYALANGLISRKGMYGIVFGIPMTTLTLLLDQRSDIVDRMKARKIYVQCEDIYSRQFPTQLWSKYSDIFSFPAMQVVESETLDSIAQICFKRGLGAGPRGVIEAFKRVAENYIQKQKIYTPIDLIDDFLNGYLISAKNSQLVSATRNMLQLDAVQGKADRGGLIKLLAAYPMYGCNGQTIEKYGFKKTFEEVRIKFYGEMIVELSEGFTLTAFATDDTAIQPSYDRMLRNFMRVYARTDEQICHALQSFSTWIIPRLFPEAKGAQISNAWRSIETEHLDSGGFRTIQEGAFSERYPFRQALITVTADEDDLIEESFEGIVVDILLDLTMASTSHGSIVVEKNRVRIRLNPQKILGYEVPIPIVRLYPETKIDVLFVLGMMYALGDNVELIPKSEVGRVEYFLRSLGDLVLAHLFSESIETPKSLRLTIFGDSTLKEIVNDLCSMLYPKYDTMIMNSQWERTLSLYTNLLKDSRVRPSAKKGGREFTITKDEMGIIVAAKKWQSQSNRLDTMAGLLEYAESDEPDCLVITLRRHPLEDLILNLLEKGEKRSKKGFEIPYVRVIDVWKESKSRGYIKREVNAAIELLCARGMVLKVDEILERVIENVDERKNALLLWRTSLEGHLSESKSVIESSAISEIPDLPLKLNIEVASTISETDSIEDELRAVEDKLKEKLIVATTKILGKLESDDSTMESLMSRIMPRYLNSEVKGTVSWVGELESCRQILLTEFHKIVIGAKKEKKRLKTEIEEIEEVDSVQDRISILLEHGEIEESKTHTRMNEFDRHAQEFDSWLTLMNNANEVQKAAINLENVHQEDRFKLRLDELNQDIVGAMRSMKLSMLSDYEIYMMKLEEIEKEVKKHEFGRREEFHKHKARIEQILSDVGVPHHKLRSMYDHQGPAESLENMQVEAREKMEHYVCELVTDVEKIRTDLRFAAIVLGKDCSDQLNRIAVAADLLDNTSDSMKKLIFRNDEMVTKLSESVNNATRAIGDAKKGYAHLVEAGTATRPEKRLLDKIRDVSKIDISELVISEMEEKGDEFSWDEFMRNVLSLFKKNLIGLLISRRR